MKATKLAATTRGMHPSDTERNVDIVASGGAVAVRLRSGSPYMTERGCRMGNHHPPVVESGGRR